MQAHYLNSSLEGPLLGGVAEAPQVRARKQAKRGVAERPGPRLPTYQSESNRRIFELWLRAAQEGRRLGFSVSEAEDLAQHAILLLLDSQVPIRDERAWISTVARRTALRRKSGARRSSSLEESEELRVLSLGSPKMDQRLILRRAFADLRPDRVRLWCDHNIAGMSLDELVSLTRLSRSTIQRRLAKIGATLRISLGVGLPTAPSAGEKAKDSYKD